jgi:hypothetical protein
MTSATPRPSQPAAAGNESQVPFAALSAVDVTIDGQAYHLPQPSEPPVQIMLLDGSLAQLLAGSIVLRGQTLPIPDGLSSVQHISVGGQSIQAQPGQSTQQDPATPDGDHGGAGGLFGFLGNIGKSASSAATGMSNAASGAISFASGAADTGGATATKLAGAFSGAANSANGVVASLNGVQKSFPTGGLSRAGMETFTKAQNLGRSSANRMQSMGNMLQGFDSLPTDIQQQVRTNMADFAKPGGQLQLASEAMNALSDFPWETEAPKTDMPSPTATPKASESARATQSATTPTSKAATSASSSGSATPTAIKASSTYYIITKAGTSENLFKEFVQELDHGVGKLTFGQYRQTYKTMLNETQAQSLKAKHDFLLVVYTDTSSTSSTDQADVGEKEMFHAIPQRREAQLDSQEVKAHLNESKRRKTMLSLPKLRPRTMLKDANAPYWKKMISNPWKQPPLYPTADDRPYSADDSGGRGTTVYILDDGFDLSQPVSILYKIMCNNDTQLTCVESCC